MNILQQVFKYKLVYIICILYFLFITNFFVIEFYKRAAILSSLLNSLSHLANSTNATVYLAQLSAANCQILYPLFIEAK
jgi:hypothetical protein